MGERVVAPHPIRTGNGLVWPLHLDLLQAEHVRPEGQQLPPQVPPPGHHLDILQEKIADCQLAAWPPRPQDEGKKTVIQTLFSLIN